MVLSLYKRKSENNTLILQKIKNNSLFRNCQKNIKSSLTFRVSKSLPLKKSYGFKEQKKSISVNEWLQDESIQIGSESISMQNSGVIQSNFYSVIPNQSVYLNQQENKQNKENKENKVNCIDFLNFPSNKTQSKISNQKKERIQKVSQILSHELMQNYSRAIKNINNLNSLQKKLVDQSTYNSQKITLIDKLINVLQKSKNIRIRNMFTERQYISEARQQKKKRCQKKLQLMKQIELKYLNRQIDQFTVVSELKCFLN